LLTLQYSRPKARRRSKTRLSGIKGGKNSAGSNPLPFYTAASTKIVQQKRKSVRDNADSSYGRKSLALIDQGSRYLPTRKEQA